MSHVNETNILLIIVITNVVLTAAHNLLYKLHETKKFKWSDEALAIVTFLMASVSWLMAARTPARSALLEDPEFKAKLKAEILAELRAAK